MIQQVPVLPFAPESNRPRLLLGANIHMKVNGGKGDMSAGMSQYTVRKLYDRLDGVKHVTIFQNYGDKVDIMGPTGELFLVKTRHADSEYFNVFDHTLLKGRYYTKAESDALLNVAVISESTAFKLFGNANPIGQTFQYAFKPYTVVGVVRDSSPLATLGHGDVFIPTSAEDNEICWNKVLGSLAAAMVVEDGVDFDHIREQVKARYAELSTEVAPDDMEAVYHEQPYDIQTIAAGISATNMTPDTTTGKRVRLLIYSILLLVPAINLSSMLHSRMRRRVSEIGVRRAFGCTRSRIITDIISENLIVTIIGGIIGFILGVIFASTFDGLYATSSSLGSGATPALSTLLNWKITITALVVCFLLNIVSAAVPAWQASRVNVVEAINANK